MFFKKAISFLLGYVFKSLIFVCLFAFLLVLFSVLFLFFFSFFKQKEKDGQKHANIWKIKQQVGQSDRMVEELARFWHYDYHTPYLDDTT